MISASSNREPSPLMNSQPYSWRYISSLRVSRSSARKAAGMRGHSSAVALMRNPILVAGPFAVKEAGFAVGRAHEPERSAADREHGPEGAIEIIRHARGFVDHEQADGGEAADCSFAFGQTDDARAVGQLDRALVYAIAADTDPELGHGLFRLFEKFCALA